MKKLVLLAVFILVLSAYSTVKSQCTPDAQCDTGYCPKVLPDACVNVKYDQSITFNVPGQFTYVFGAVTIQATIDTVKIVKIENQPASLTYETTPSDYFKGNSKGCLHISGTPTVADKGAHTLKITIHIAGKIYGNYVPYDSSFNEIIIIKDSCGSGISMKDAVSFQVFQNAPNPCTGKTEIDYFSPVVDNVSFEVYNLVGVLVATEKYKSATGLNKLIFDSKELPSGVYFYKLSTSTQSSTHRMIISR